MKILLSVALFLGIFGAYTGFGEELAGIQCNDLSIYFQSSSVEDEFRIQVFKRSGERMEYLAVKEKDNLFRFGDDGYIELIPETAIGYFTVNFLPAGSDEDTEVHHHCIGPDRPGGIISN